MNRKELYDFATSLDQKDAPVGALLVAIDEAHSQISFASSRLAALAAAATKAAVGYGIEGQVMTLARDYEVGAAKLNTLFLTLAVVLEQQGHKVDY